MSKDTTPDNHQPVVSGSAILSAGLASAGAATITSRFGVAGTLVGAALTTMIITGGAAILKAYLEAATGKVRGFSGRFSKRGNRKAAPQAEPKTVPERPDLRNNFVGRMRAALGWFSRLPTGRRRSILIKGLIAAVVAFLIAMAAVYGGERLIGNSFSCGFWGNCPYGAEPGIHPLGYGGTGAGSSVGVGGSDSSIPSGGGVQNTPFGNPSDGSPFSGGQQEPSSASSSSSAEPDASASASPEPEEEDPSSASASSQPRGGAPSSDSSAPAQ